MSKVGVIGAVVIVVGAVGGGGYYYLSNQAGKQLQNTVSLIEQSVPGSSIKYENYSVNPFSKSVTLHKLVAKDDKGQEYLADTVTIAGVSKDKVENVSVDKFHTIWNGNTIDIAHLDAKNIVPHDGAIVLENGKIVKVVPSKFSFDLLNVQNFSAISPDKTTVTVAQYQLKNYGLKQKSDQTVQQLEAKAGDDGKEYFKLNQAQINGLDVAQISALIEQGQTPKANPGEPTKAIIEGMSASYSDQSWSIAKFETENSAAENGDFKRSAVFSGLKINTAHNAKLYPVKQIGYDELDVSGNIVGSYDKAKQQWSITPFTLNVKDMGNLDATLKFNAPGDLVNVNPQELATNYKLISFKVTLKNEGLLQKVFASQAKKQNISVDQVKQNTIKEIQQDADTAVIPVQKQGDEALLGLINDPTKSLVIEMNPVTPVATMDLLSKSQIEIFDTLKLSVKADAAK